MLMMMMVSVGEMLDWDEGGGDDVDGSVVVVLDGGDGEGGMEMMPAAGRSWPERWGGGGKYERREEVMCVVSEMVDRDEGGGDDVDGLVVVALNRGDGECGVEMMSAAGRSWPERWGGAGKYKRGKEDKKDMFCVLEFEPDIP
uniref:Uncharacterized protein n=1 Tax=Tanacetum cinerariifolium TaxID=118510 RepID=A0A6L2MMR7_TANCI|nr:hypothetical protein [Tanacetum cinerariifolium]